MDAFQGRSAMWCENLVIKSLSKVDIGRYHQCTLSIFTTNSRIENLIAFYGFD